MSLYKTEPSHNYMTGEPRATSEELFATVERRLKNKKSLIEDMQNEYDLLEKQAFNTYKHEVIYFFFDSELIKHTRDWLTMVERDVDSNGCKLDKRKKYDEKDSANFFTDYLKRTLDCQDLELVTIYEYNFGEGWSVIFTSHNETWELYIPMVQNVSIKSYKDSGCSVFQLKILHADSKNCYSWVGSTYEEDNLKTIMAYGIAKYVTSKES